MTGPRRRLARAFLAVACVASTVAVVAAQPAAALKGGPPHLAALTAQVQDACTHRAVPAVQATLVDATGAPHSPSKLLASSFTFKKLTAGSFRLFVTAPGYEALVDASGSSGAPVGVNPGPFVGPVGALTQELKLGIRLAPLVPPGPCKRLGPLGKPRAMGIVHDGSTGAPVGGLAVTILDPRTGQPIPGPVVNVTTGHFAEKNLPDGPSLVSLSVMSGGPNASGFNSPFNVPFDSSGFNQPFNSPFNTGFNSPYNSPFSDDFNSPFNGGFNSPLDGNGLSSSIVASVVWGIALQPCVTCP